MSKTEEQIKSEWGKIDEQNIEKACQLLKKQTTDTQYYLARCIASVCNIEEKDMFARNDGVHVTHARWLYWYAYRYMTREPCKCISRHTAIFGKTYREQSIARCIGKMGQMIENEPIWGKRWIIIKRIIKLRDTKEESIDNTITINISRELKDKIKIEIKEK